MDDLQTQLTQAAESLHALILSRVAFKLSRDAASYNAVTDAMNRVIDQYNTLAQQINAQQTPGLVMRTLDHVSDFALWSAKTVATTTVNAVATAGSVAGSLTLKVLAPAIVTLGVVLALVVYAAGKSGALKVTRLR